MYCVSLYMRPETFGTTLVSAVTSFDGPHTTSYQHPICMQLCPSHLISFRDVVRFWRKIATFSYPTCIWCRPSLDGRHQIWLQYCYPIRHWLLDYPFSCFRRTSALVRRTDWQHCDVCASRVKTEGVVCRENDCTCHRANFRVQSFNLIWQVATSSGTDRPVHSQTVWRLNGRDGDTALVSYTFESSPSQTDSPSRRVSAARATSQIWFLWVADGLKWLVISRLSAPNVCRQHGIGQRSPTCF